MPAAGKDAATVNQGWFRKFQIWIGRFLYGRYGGDQLGVALLVLYCVLLVFSDVFRLPVLYFASLAALAFCLYRMLSRNRERRWKENAWFLGWWGPAAGWFRSLFRRLRAGWRRLGMRVRDRRTSRYYRCPKCGNTLRVPKGRGKIVITCPVCRHEFVKKT